jgi:hypothetical protein
MLAPRILPKMVPRLCFEGLRDIPLPSNAALLVGLEKTISAVVEDERGLGSTRVVDDCGPEVPCVVSPCEAF